MDKQKSNFSTENSILGESQWAVNVKVNNTDKTKFFWLTGKLTFMLHYRIHTSLSRNSCYYQFRKWSEISIFHFKVMKTQLLADIWMTVLSPFALSNYAPELTTPKKLLNYGSKNTELDHHPSYVYKILFTKRFYFVATLTFITISEWWFMQNPDFSNSTLQRS